MSGTVSTTGSIDATATNDQLSQLQSTYQQAQAFELALTAVKTTEDAKLDAAKQRPQI